MTDAGFTDARTGVLLVTDDDLLRAEVARLVAAAGVDLLVETPQTMSVRHWSTAVVVLVGADAVAGVARTGPPRRDRVHLVGREFTDAVYADALLGRWCHPVARGPGAAGPIADRCR